MNQTKLLFPLIFISLEDEPWEPIEPNPNAAPEDDSDVAEQDLSQSDWTLASTETVTHEYLTQSGKVVRETITTSMDTTTLDFFYDESGRPFAFNYSVDGSDFETYYYILNLQGDVVQIIDANGVLQAEYVYSPWGEIISAEGDLAEINPLRYRGYYYDSETGFYYLQSRYYDPENHRFINADTYASTDSSDAIACNMFAYCGNNPVMFRDAAGEFAIGTAILIGALIIGGGVALYTGCEARKAGCGWDDTIFYAAGAGLCAFAAVYTFGTALQGAVQMISASLAGPASSAPNLANSSGISANDPVNLYRVGTPEEYLTTIQNGKFSAATNAYDTGKFFATSFSDEEAWGQKFYRGADSAILALRIDPAALVQEGVEFWEHLDGIGQAYYIPMKVLETFTISIN